MFTCVIRYQIEPDRLDEFREYARTWIALIRKYGGTHHGYFVPGTDADSLPNAAFSFPGLVPLRMTTSAKRQRPDSTKRNAFRVTSERSWCRSSTRPRSRQRPAVVARKSARDGGRAFRQTAATVREALAECPRLSPGFPPYGPEAIGAIRGRGARGPIDRVSGRRFASALATLPVRGGPGRSAARRRPPARRCAAGSAGGRAGSTGSRPRRCR